MSATSSFSGKGLGKRLGKALVTGPTSASAERPPFALPRTVGSSWCTAGTPSAWPKWFGRSRTTGAVPGVSCGSKETV